MNAEEVKVGCFQVVIAILLAVNYVIVAMSHALPAFYNYTPEFYCQIRNETKRTYGCQDLRKMIVENNVTSDHENVSNYTNLCFGDYQFATEFGENSVVTEWNLICEKRYLTFLGPIVYYVGVLIGAWIAGILSDRIGRLPVLAICLYTQGTMAVALYVVQDYPTFLALRGLQGVFVQGLQNSTYILSLELFPANARTFIALVMQIAWAIGLLLLATLSYAIPDWRILQLAVSVPTAVTVLYIWIVPESPRWLLAKGKTTEADMALERIVKYNACCVSSHQENVKTDEIGTENTTPLKPERKSRVSSSDLKKLKTDTETNKEATNLLLPNDTENMQQTNRKTSVGGVSENLEVEFPKMESALVDSPECSEIKKKDRPTSLKSHRKSKSISQPATADVQQLCMKNAYDIVELRTAANKEILYKDEETIEKRVKEKPRKAQTAQELKDAFKSTMLRRCSVVLFCQWLTSSMAWCVYMTLVPNFPVNRHITFALGSALEIATYVFVYFILSRYGRRLPMSACQSFNGVICILLAAIIILTRHAFVDLTKTIILLFGRVAVTSTICITYLYTIEIYPTVVRGTFLGFCTVVAKIGSLCTPHVLLSGEHFPVTIPLIVIGMLCLVSGGLALILPETLDIVLPDTVEDSKLLTAKRRDKEDNETINNENLLKKEEDLSEREILRTKLFSEDWVDAGNGILVNFTDNKNTEQ